MICGSDHACTSAAFKRPCKSNYQWRQAYADDWVCVTKDSHDQAQRDNAEARSKRADYERPVH
ncbi:hypothetical protein RugamoR64_37730 [Duganella rhizosphaerae]